MAAFDMNQPAILRILPNRKLRTGGAPCVHRFLIGSIFAGKPLEQIEDQDFHRLRHYRYFIDLGTTPAFETV